MIGKVVRIQKNAKGIFGFIKTEAGKYYYDTSSLSRGTFLKMGDQVEFESIPWKGGKPKAIRVRVVEQSVLEAEIQKTNHDETHPAEFGHVYAVQKKIPEEMIIQIRGALMAEIEKSGFILASRLPSVLRSFGISQYREYAVNLDSFIEQYIPDTFVAKHGILIKQKKYPKIFILKEEESKFEQIAETESDSVKTTEPAWNPEESADAAQDTKEQGKAEQSTILRKVQEMLDMQEYEAILRLEEVGDWGPQDFGDDGIELLLKAVAGFLGENTDHIQFNDYHRLLINTETVADLKPYKENERMLEQGAETAIIPMTAEEYRRIFADIHNGKKNSNAVWNGIIERFWTAKSELAFYLTCLWLVVVRQEKCIDLYIEEAAKISRIDKLPMLLKINQVFGEHGVSVRLQRKIMGRCFDLNDTAALAESCAYFGETAIPETEKLAECLKEKSPMDDELLMKWFHCEIGPQISEKAVNYYWWKYSSQGIDASLFKVLALVYWEYPEYYYTEIIYNPACPLFGKKEKETLLRNHFVRLCHEARTYTKAYPWVNYLYLTLFSEEKEEDAECAWEDLHSWMKAEVAALFSEDVRTAGNISLFRLDENVRNELEEQYCETYVAPNVQRFSEEELDEFVELCEKQKLSFITQWIVEHSNNTVSVSDEETHVRAFVSARKYEEAIRYLQKSEIGQEKKNGLIREILCENFKAYNVDEKAFAILEQGISADEAENALCEGLKFTDHDEIVALVAVYIYKKEWVKAVYLMVPIRVFYLDAHRKFIEDARILLHQKYNIDIIMCWSNHYEVVKRALRIYDIQEFDAFMEWTRIIKIPKNSSKYTLRPRTFDNFIQSMISGEEKDGCWNQLVRMALRTDNNDRQDDLRFCIIASYMGRYGLHAIEYVIESMAHNTNATKGYVDYYVSLWKGLLNGKYNVNFLRLCQSLIGVAPITFWNVFYDAAAVKNHIFASDHFDWEAWRNDLQNYQEFYSNILNCYVETREVVYLKIAVVLLKDCGTQLIPELEKYISFCNSTRSKSFLLSALATLLQEGRYQEEIRRLISSEYWNCSPSEQEVLRLLEVCCMDQVDIETEYGTLTENEWNYFKKDCLQCIKSYPELEIEYALRLTDRNASYRLKLLKAMLRIQYSPVMRGEAENAPKITENWREDPQVTDYLKFVELLYQKQAQNKENLYNDAMFIKNRYIRLFVSKLLLEDKFEEYSDDQVIALMNENKHFTAIYSEYEQPKKYIYELLEQRDTSDYLKAVFLIGFLSNQWGQFIDCVDQYGLHALEIICKIEALTNYRDFHIQILQRYVEEADSEFDDEEILSFEICSPKVYTLLCQLKQKKKQSEMEYQNVKKLIAGICRFHYPGKAQRSYTYMKWGLRTCPEELKKNWDLYMLALEATSYKKTMIVNLLDETKKGKLDVNELKLWMPIFRTFGDLPVYYYILAARYALDRKREEAKEAFAFIGERDELPKEWGEDIKNLKRYLSGKEKYFSMTSSTLQALTIEKEAEAVSFIQIAFSKEEIKTSTAVKAYRTILSKETEDIVKLNAYKQLFSVVKKPDDLLDIYPQAEGKETRGKANRLTYNELMIEYGSLLICLETELSAAWKMQILLEIFSVFEFLNDMNKCKNNILERLGAAEQNVLEVPGVAFEDWMKNRDRILHILSHPAIQCSDAVIEELKKPVDECVCLIQKCSSEMQKLSELSKWRENWNLQQNCSNYEYAFVRSVDEKIKQLKRGINLSIRVVNKTMEEYSIFYLVENRAEVSNAAVLLNNSSDAGSAKLEVFLGINGGEMTAYEGASFTNMVELRPGDACGQCYRLHNTVVSSLKDGDVISVLFHIIVDQKVICSCNQSFLYRANETKGLLREKLRSDVSKYETSVPAFSHVIRGFGRETEKRLIRQYLEQQFVVIYGPSRVGKSSLVNYISNDYIKVYSEQEGKSVIAIGIADDRHGNDYSDDMLNEQQKVSFDNVSDILRYLFISPLKIAFASGSGKSRMRCKYAGEKISDAAEAEINDVIRSEGSVREIVAMVSQILEENNCQIWYLFDEFQEIVKQWKGDTKEFTDLCNDVINYQNSIKIVICGSDELVRLYQCENDIQWSGFVQKTADKGVIVGQLSRQDFKEMMQDETIWKEVAEKEEIPWSSEALELLYQYTGGNAICGKLFGNELITKLRNGEFENRQRFYPSDITQVAYELLNSEVGLVKNLLVLHTTKNLEDEMVYLLFIAHELVQDRNKADVSIRRIREFFSAKSAVEIENALKILIARGILKSNEKKHRYGFSTMFYFDFFRNQATENKLQEIAEQMQGNVTEIEEAKVELHLTDPKEISDTMITLWSDLGKVDESNPDKNIQKKKIQNFIGPIINAKQINTGDGNIKMNEGGEVTNNIQINIQNMSTALTNIMTGQHVLESYQDLPKLSSYIASQLTGQDQRLLESKYRELQEEGLSVEQRQNIQEDIYEISSPAIDAIASDYVAAEMNAIMNGTYSYDDENMSDPEAIGLSKDTIDELKQVLPAGIQIQFDFAIMLHRIFYQLKDEKNIDYCPVAILYCKLIEGLLKEKHFEIYIKKLSRGKYPKVRVDNQELEWSYFLDHSGKPDKKKVKKYRRKLTLGSFSFPLGRIANCKDIDSKILINQEVVEALATPVGDDMTNAKDLQLWKKHAEMLPWIREYRNRSAHELTPISRQDMDHICSILFEKRELERIVTLIQRQ